MEKDKITEEEAEAVELVLFQVPECYVYMVKFSVMIRLSLHVAKKSI